MRQSLECVVILLLCGLLVGCGSGEKAVAQVTPRDAAGFMIAAGMAGFSGDVNLQANGRMRFGIEEGVYADSPGTEFGARGRVNAGSVSPENMKHFVEAMKLLGIADGDAPLDPGSDPPDALSDDTATGVPIPDGEATG